LKVTHYEVLAGISLLSFQLNAASLPHGKLMRAIEAIGTRVVPAVLRPTRGRSWRSSQAR